MWPDTRLLELFEIEAPIVQAPMAGAMDAELVIAAAEGGALGSLPCAMLSAEKLREQVALIRARVAAPINLNFFCHTPLADDPQRAAAWRERLASEYVALGLDPRAPSAAASRAPFDATSCALVEELKPRVVSFHFGLPEKALLDRVKAAGCIVIASATTVKEATWLEARGVDAIIAQGAEAGGHRGMFLTEDLSAQPGTIALVPQVVDAVGVPVIAAGGIADARGIVAAFALGAAGVQLGTVYLRCPEAKIAAPYRAALARATDESTVLTNVFTGRPARGIRNKAVATLGPVASDAPAFPHAATALAPLRAAAERAGSSDFTPLWAGQAVALSREVPAAELTRELAAGALRAFSGTR
ncbi:MAG: 2-nitropropane dioxygenase [Myxococcaceae bacterium]|nr:2-nitropropane dioxygenase [Myxococcaceae bacterium]